LIKFARNGNHHIEFHRLRAATCGPDAGLHWRKQMMQFNADSVCNAIRPRWLHCRDPADTAQELSVRLIW